MKKWKQYIHINKKAILLTALAIASLVSVMSVGSTYAYLKIVNDTPASNSFSVASSADPSIVDESGAKVSVGNTGYSVYVRAAIVATWEDNSGNVLGTATGYTLSDKDENWVLGSDGYYYFKEPVASGGKTAVLFTSCTATETAPEGYHLSIDVLAQTVQAAGKDGDTMAVTQAWGCAVAGDKTITPPSA